MSTIHAPGPLARLRTDFPILDRRVNGKRLVYLDSAATAQKPQAVLDALDDYYTDHNANVHRGVYTLAEEATAAYEGARAKTARFINAPSPREVIFTRSTTEATNLVAHAWGRSALTAGDIVVLTHMEHHANIVPWHMLAAERGIELRWIPLTPDGHLDLRDLPGILEGAKLLGVTAVSNVLGTINDIAPLAEAAHAAGALVLVDAAQAAPHLRIDVAGLGADFVAFSGHKMLGPTGIGVLWARRDLLDRPRQIHTERVDDPVGDSRPLAGVVRAACQHQLVAGARDDVVRAGRRDRLVLCGHRRVVWDRCAFAGPHGSGDWAR